MRQNALATLKQLGWRPGEPLFYVIDDTQTEKFGKQMEGVSRIWLHSEKRYVLGIQFFGEHRLSQCCYSL